MSKRWCVCLLPPVEPGTVDRGAALLDAMWAPDTEITVSFLDGDPGLQARVRAAAERWVDLTDMALRFAWREDTTATDIRISFAHAGSWSKLGRYSREGAGASMNFGWLRPDSDDAAIQSVVLHEFGHALGLIHEHQHPEAAIAWDEDAVIAELSGPPNNWDVGKIRWNVLDKMDAEALVFEPYDPDSIMHYEFPATWRKDGLASHDNPDLSPGDVALINRLYGPIPS